MKTTKKPAVTRPARPLNWAFDLALLVLAWRLAINPIASWWRDPPAVLAAFWIAVSLVAAGNVTRAAAHGEPDADASRVRRRAVQAITLAAMVLLLVLFALRQVPLTMAALGLSR